MILADTSVWIDHLRSKDLTLSTLLERSEIITHADIIGEMKKCQQKFNIPKAEACTGRIATVMENSTT